jgi:hypothetical protein
MTLLTHFLNTFSRVCHPDEGRTYRPLLKNILIVTLLFISSFVKADSTFTFVPKGKSFLIGDQFEITAILKLPINSKAVWPVFSDTINSKLEIIKQSKRDSSIEKNQRVVSQKITVTCFEKAFVVLAPIEIKNNEGQLIAQSSAQLIEIKDIVTTGDTIKDIKAPLETPFIWVEIKNELIYGSIALLILTALAIFLWWYFKKRKKPAVKMVVPEITAKDSALQKLLLLDNKKLWQQGQIKEFQSELSFLLREFIEKKFGVIAMELTTAEIMQQMSRTAVPTNEKEKLQRILQIADMTKFAKAEPSANENELCFTLTKDFILTCG